MSQAHDCAGYSEQFTAKYSGNLNQLHSRYLYFNVVKQGVEFHYTVCQNNTALTSIEITLDTVRLGINTIRLLPEQPRFGKGISPDRVEQTISYADNHNDMIPGDFKMFFLNPRDGSCQEGNIRAHKSTYLYANESLTSQGLDIVTLVRMPFELNNNRDIRHGDVVHACLYSDYKYASRPAITLGSNILFYESQHDSSRTFFTYGPNVDITRVLRGPPTLADGILTKSSRKYMFFMPTNFVNDGMSVLLGDRVDRAINNDEYFQSEDDYTSDDNDITSMNMMALTTVASVISLDNSYTPGEYALCWFIFIDDMVPDIRASSQFYMFKDVTITHRVVNVTLPDMVQAKPYDVAYTFLTDDIVDSVKVKWVEHDTECTKSGTTTADQSASTFKMRADFTNFAFGDYKLCAYYTMGDEDVGGEMGTYLQQDIITYLHVGPAASVVGDPHVRGADGTWVDFFGDVGVYELFHGSQIQANAKFSLAASDNFLIWHPKVMKAGTMMEEVGVSILGSGSTIRLGIYGGGLVSISDSLEKTTFLTTSDERTLQFGSVQVSWGPCRLNCQVAMPWGTHVRKQVLAISGQHESLTLFVTDSSGYRFIDADLTVLPSVQPTSSGLLSDAAFAPNKMQDALSLGQESQYLVAGAVVEKQRLIVV